jgi:membrane protein YqaA with SNARE-associated domain
MIKSLTTSDATPLYAQLAGHSGSWTAQGFAFLWGLAEATLFFVVPDVYLGFVALFGGRKGLAPLGGALAGALAGGAITYLVAASDRPTALALLLAVPGVTPSMVANVGEVLRTSGLGALLGGPFGGIPYKVYAAQAGFQGQPFGPFLVLTLPARLIRFLPVSLVCGAGGELLRPFLRRHPSVLIAAYALAWIGIYVVYAVYVVPTR